MIAARHPGHGAVSVCMPARDEAATIGPIVSAIVRSGTAAEVIVCDDGSSDATADIAARCGATVVWSATSSGKGGAMRAAAARATGEIVVFLDADVRNFTADWVGRLAAPLLADPGIVLVKGMYGRPLNGVVGEGGRVTELVARPLLAVCRPSLGVVRQPLAGETAVRRTVLDAVPLADGYAVEIALLLAVEELWGAGAIAQVDLGVRVHRNRPLSELAGQAREIVAEVLRQSGVVAVDLQPV